MTDSKPQPAPGELAREDGTLDGGAILRLLDRPLTPEDLRDATERVARPLTAAKDQAACLLLFRAQSERLALPATSVVRVTPQVPVRRIPHRSNNIIRGLCNIEGQLLVCASLENLLQLASGGPDNESDTSDGLRRMIALGDGLNQWAVEVDAVDGVVYTDPRDDKRPPLTVQCSLKRYTDSLVPIGDSFASLLSVERVLAGFREALS